jgi:hypothetical protein
MLKKKHRGPGTETQVTGEQPGLMYLIEILQIKADKGVMTTSVVNTPFFPADDVKYLPALDTLI